MSVDLFIIGTSGLAREVAQLARKIDPKSNIWPNIHYVTNNPKVLNQELLFGKIDTLDDELWSKSSPSDVVVGIGYPDIRERVARSLRPNHYLSFPNLIHPGVDIDRELVNIGVGNIITQGVVMTCNIELGDFNLVNWNVSIGHDASIGSWNVINPGSRVSGCVSIANTCLVGTGACILEGVKLKDRTTLGAGAVLTKSTQEAGQILVGVPANPMLKVE